MSDELRRLERRAARGDLAAARRIKEILESRRGSTAEGREEAALRALADFPDGGPSQMRLAVLWVAGNAGMSREEAEEALESLFSKRRVDATGRPVHPRDLSYWSFGPSERVLFVQGGWAASLRDSGRSGWLSHRMRGYDGWIQYDDGRIAYDSASAPLAVRKKLEAIMWRRFRRGLR